MKIDIFIKSYHKDFKWLRHCMASIRKYVTGYNEIIILIPEDDREQFNMQLPDRTFVHTVKESGNGYLFQQWCKLTAHKYSGADFIAFTDSDCVFKEPFDYQTAIKEGKSEILYTSYLDDNGNNQLGDGICWKAATEKFIGQSVDFEFMRRNNLIYRRETLINLERWFRGDLKKYIMSQHTFSEFNVLGAYAFLNEREKYNFVNTKDWTYVDTPFVQFWSWSGLTPEDKAKIKELLKENTI